MEEFVIVWLEVTASICAPIWLAWAVWRWAVRRPAPAAFLVALTLTLLIGGLNFLGLLGLYALFNADSDMTFDFGLATPTPARTAAVDLETRLLSTKDLPAGWEGGVVRGDERLEIDPNLGASEEGPPLARALIASMTSPASPSYCLGPESAATPGSIAKAVFQRDSRFDSTVVAELLWKYADVTDAAKLMDWMRESFETCRMNLGISLTKDAGFSDECTVSRIDITGLGDETLAYRTSVSQGYFPRAEDLVLIRDNGVVMILLHLGFRTEKESDLTKSVDSGLTKSLAGKAHELALTGAD